MKTLPDSKEIPVVRNLRHCEPCEGGCPLGEEVCQNPLRSMAEMWRGGPVPEPPCLAPPGSLDHTPFNPLWLRKPGEALAGRPRAPGAGGLMCSLTCLVTLLGAV